jgi:hypothetical protein
VCVCERTKLAKKARNEGRNFGQKRQKAKRELEKAREP